MELFSCCSKLHNTVFYTVIFNWYTVIHIAFMFGPSAGVWAGGHVAYITDIPRRRRFSAHYSSRDWHVQYNWPVLDICLLQRLFHNIKRQVQMGATARIQLWRWVNNCIIKCLLFGQWQINSVISINKWSGKCEWRSTVYTITLSVSCGTRKWGRTEKDFLCFRRYKEWYL